MIGANENDAPALPIAWLPQNIQETCTPVEEKAMILIKIRNSPMPPTGQPEMEKYYIE